MNEQDNASNFFRFEDLRIYAKAMDYIVWLYNEIGDEVAENHSKTCFKDTFFKSAQAIALQMAEGASRNKAQFLYYLKLAKSAVRECVVYTEMAVRLDIMNDEQRTHSRTQLMELTKMVGSLISSLQRSTSGNPKVGKDELPGEDFPEFE